MPQYYLNLLQRKPYTLHPKSYTPLLEDRIYKTGTEAAHIWEPQNPNPTPHVRSKREAPNCKLQIPKPERWYQCLLWAAWCSICMAYESVGLNPNPQTRNPNL